GRAGRHPGGVGPWWTAAVPCAFLQLRSRQVAFRGGPATAPGRRPHASAGRRRLQRRSVLRHRLLIRAGGLRADLLDAVAQLAAEDELGIARPALQLAVEGQLAVLVQLHQPQLAQLLDEAAEQGLVEKKSVV